MVDTAASLDVVALWLTAIVFLAFAVETTIGFGATIVTVALGALVTDIKLVLPPFILLNVVLSAYLVVRHWKNKRLDVLVKQIIPMMALGMPIGMLAYKYLNVMILKQVFAVFVILLALYELLLSKRHLASATRRPMSRSLERGFLGVGGVVHGAFGTGSPMVIFILGSRMPNKEEFRTTLAALWLVMNVVLVLGYWGNGELNAKSLSLALYFVPALALGLFLGEHLHKVVPMTTFRNAVNVMLLLAGLLLLLSPGVA